MGYYIDLGKISLDEYQKRLESSYLPPSRMILKENIAERFSYFKQEGITNVKSLLQTLKKKQSFNELSEAGILGTEYLTILLRELRSILPKPNKLSEFKNIPSTTVERLESQGIKNTEKLYPHILTKDDRNQLSKLTGIDSEGILQLAKLTDLSRIKWVGTTYANILYQLEVDTIEKVSKADPEALHIRINEFIKQEQIFRGQIGLNDVKILVQTAQELSSEIEF